MRILVHDYCGHPFQARLSRQLASRGHDVLHLFSTSVLSPQGALTKGPDDPPRVTFRGLTLFQQVDKQTYIRRYLQERAYGSLLEDEILAFAPQVVISSNAPLEAQKRALRGTRTVQGRFIFWLQDIHGLAISQLLGRKLGLVGRIAGAHFRRIEQQLLLRSDAVVAISDDFRELLNDWGLAEERTFVIPNWASREELPERAKDNPWAHEHDVHAKFCFLYAGTLGMKHNPELLLELALNYRSRGDVRITVISEGAGADWLSQKSLELNLQQLKVLPFQPYSALPDVMGAADVLVAVLERDAGVFSVPSKVLSYLCAARPLLLAVPGENLAARTVLQCGAGTVVDPRDLQGFLRAAEHLRLNSQERSEMSNNARQYAKQMFDVDRITDRFEQVFEVALGKGGIHEARTSLRRGGVHR